MIRTRDLFLFVLVLVFLVIAITTTVWFDDSGSHSTDTMTSFVEDSASTTAAAPEVAMLDRAAHIADLREKIAADTSTITPAPSVEGEGVDTAAAINDHTPAGVPAVQRCLYPDDMLSKVPQWPLSGVRFEVVEGARLVTHTESVPIVGSEGTSTIPTLQEVKRTLLTMPLAVSSAGAPHCLPSEIVGVSISGYLMFNTDVRAFKGLSSEMLIGYARDGYPIYGPYSGELDQCGGYQAPGGYRYSLSPDREYVLGCFMGTPAAFTL